MSYQAVAVVIPDLMYGTAWKEDATAGLVERALAAGFRAFDTANQRKHYHEAAVGEALRAGLAGGTVARDDLFVQTKFTFVDGQDARLPYDPAAPIATQVEQSFASSLEHLGIARIDSVLLHGPSLRDGLGRKDHEAWRALEALAGAGKATQIGISNVSALQLRELVRFAKLAPAYVQNRCYADRGWDRDVRALCREHAIAYQGFSLLTANRTVMASIALAKIAARYARTPAQIIFRLARQLGIVPLTGTRDALHMQQDLAAVRDDVVLEPRELASLGA